MIASASASLFDDLPGAALGRIAPVADPLADPLADPGLRGVLSEGGPGLAALATRLAGRDGPILPIRILASPPRPEDDDPWDLLEERTVSVNTAAAGGNASLMALDA